MTVVLLLSSLSVAAAKIYKCEDSNGITIYSQTPCDKAATAVDVKVVPAPANKEPQSVHERELDAVGQYVEQQTKDRKIAHHERNINRLKTKLAAEFKQLQDQRYRTAEDKNKAIEALSMHYNQLIAAEQKAIKAIYHSH